MLQVNSDRVPLMIPFPEGFPNRTMAASLKLHVVSRREFPSHLPRNLHNVPGTWGKVYPALDELYLQVTTFSSGSQTG